MLAYIKENRADDAPLDVLFGGRTTGKDAAKDANIVAPFADVGVTWWQEGFDWSNSVEDLRQRIRTGPPSI
jgi:hypothetical protein